MDTKGKAKLDDVNLMISALSNDIADLESKLDKTKKEKEEIQSEVQKKDNEISDLRKEIENLNKTISDNNQGKDKEKQEINEKYSLLLQQKNQLEKDKNEIKKMYEEMKNNVEIEKKKYLNLDQRFYEYKKEYNLNKPDDDKLHNINKELEETKKELNTTKNSLKDNEKKLKEATNMLNNLQKENEKLKSEREELKRESYDQIQEMKVKLERASKNVFSTDKILTIIGENIHTLFVQEFSLSLNNIIEEILKKFIIYSQSIFTTTENGETYIHNDENIYLYILKDIYFYIYFYVFNLKKKGQDPDISISSNDFTDEIINNLSFEIYKNNIIHSANQDSQKSIDEYMNKLKKLKVEDDQLSIIKESYTKRNENFKMYLLNMIKSLVKKCADTIRNSTIEVNNKILYDFRNYRKDQFTLEKNYLQISLNTVNNENIEALINILRYPTEKITRILFNSNFDKNLSEFNIQKLLLNLITYNSGLLSLSFNDCKNISLSIISNIIFSIQNIKNLKILNIESCNLNDNHIKILFEGLRDNKSIIALMLRKNNITSQGAFYVSEYLSKNINIKQLFLGDNNIKDKGLEALFNAISRSKNISIIDISNNNFSRSDFDILIDYLKTNPILNSLDISGNKLDLKSSVNLGPVLSGIKNISSINMTNMGIISELIPNLFKSYNLNEIILDDNNLEEVGLIMLIKALDGNKNLKKISLKNTQLSFIGLTSLLKMLEKKKDFKELHLENNVIDDSCINIMKTSLKNKQFKIFVTKSMINHELFKEDALGKESNIIMV